MKQLVEHNEFNYNQISEELSLLKEATENPNSFDLAEVEAEYVGHLLTLFADHNVSAEDIKYYLENPNNESIVGSILGGLTGFALGKRVGKAVAKVLGIQKGILYDLLTSRLVGAGIGSALGGRI